MMCGFRSKKVELQDQSGVLRRPRKGNILPRQISLDIPALDRGWTRSGLAGTQARGTSDLVRGIHGSRKEDGKGNSDFTADRGLLQV